MAKQGKKYKAALQHVDPNKSYDMAEACEILKKTAVTKFDSSCEVHIRLGVDTKMKNFYHI